MWKEEGYKARSFIQILHLVLEEFSLNLDRNIQEIRQQRNSTATWQLFEGNHRFILEHIQSYKVYKVEGTLYINYFFSLWFKFDFDLNLTWRMFGGRPSQSMLRLKSLWARKVVFISCRISAFSVNCEKVITLRRDHSNLISFWDEVDLSEIRKAQNQKNKESQENKKKKQPTAWRQRRRFY